MSDKRPVVVYGVSGVAGRLICEYLRDYNIPFIAAGANRREVQAAIDAIPGIETADYEVREVEHTVEALTELFRGAKFISNIAEPLIEYGCEVVEACLAAGCHYSDVTGERGWVTFARACWGPAFEKKRLLLAPNITRMPTAGKVTATIYLDSPGLGVLDMLALWRGFPGLVRCMPRSLPAFRQRGDYRRRACDADSTGTGMELRRARYREGVRNVVGCGRFKDLGTWPL